MTPFVLRLCQQNVELFKEQTLSYCSSPALNSKPRSIASPLILVMKYQGRWLLWDREDTSPNIWPPLFEQSS